jgi:hypothetical protein
MILDGDLKLSAAQALTATAASTSVLDLTAAGDAISPELWAVVRVGTALDSTEEDATLTVALESDSASDFSTNSTKIVHAQTAAIAEASCTANTILWKIKLPPGLQRYVRFYYTVGVHDFTGGTVDAFLTYDVNHATKGLFKA